MRIEIILLVIFTFLFISCEKSGKLVTPTDKDEIFVTKFDVEEMKQRHLPDFKLVRKRAMFNSGKEYIFQNIQDEENVIFIRACILPSKKRAHDFVKHYCDLCEMLPIEFSDKDFNIGDKCWWMVDPISPDTVQYHFTRYNIFILVNSHTYNDIQQLAGLIDKDIINGANYVSKEETISIPVIYLVSAEKTEVWEEETVKIFVSASDPFKKKLEYVFNYGLFHIETDSINVFTFKASRDMVSEPFFGAHTFEFQVINENLVISETAKVTIKIGKSPVKGCVVQ